MSMDYVEKKREETLENILEMFRNTEFKGREVRIVRNGIDYINEHEKFHKWACQSCDRRVQDGETMVAIITTTLIFGREVTDVLGMCLHCAENMIKEYYKRKE